MVSITNVKNSISVFNYSTPEKHQNITIPKSGGRTIKGFDGTSIKTNHGVHVKFSSSRTKSKKTLIPKRKHAIRLKKKLNWITGG